MQRLRVCSVTRMRAHSHFDGSWIIPTHQIQNLVMDSHNQPIKLITLPRVSPLVSSMCMAMSAISVIKRQDNMKAKPSG